MARKRGGKIENRANRLSTMATHPPDSGGHTPQREPVNVRFEKAHPSHPGKAFVAPRGKRAYAQDVSHDKLVGAHHDNLKVAKKKAKKP